GRGSFMPGANANPTKGTIGRTHYEGEEQIHITYPRANERKVLDALFKNHPYEEVAYEIQTLENANQHIGMGMIGEMDRPVGEIGFLRSIKEKMGVSCIRHSQLLGKKIRKVAVLGGSGAFAIQAARASGANAVITSDIKYHQFYEAGNQLIIADIGHYETEQFTKNLIVDYLTKKFPNFALSLSESITNPIKYF